MNIINSKRGFSFTLMAIIILVVVGIMTPSFFSLVFFARNSAINDSLKQQAYYNANSGVEYAKFIIEHDTAYDPLNPGSWPKKSLFDCFSDPGKGTAEVAIESEGTGYKITSKGTVKQATTTIVVHMTTGKVDKWE